MASGEQTHLLRSSGDHTTVVRPRTRLTVEPVVFLLICTNTLKVPVMQQYLYMRVGKAMNFTNPEQSACSFPNHSDPTYILQQEVQRESSLWMNYYNSCLLFFAVLTSTFLGGYSDKGGRKIGLLVPVCGSLLNVYLVMVIVLYELPRGWLLAAATIEGVSGGSVVFLMAAFSLISDITTSRERSFRVIILEVMIGVGVSMAYLSSGLLIDSAGFLGTCIFAHFLLVVILAWTAFFVPETIKKQPDTKFFTVDNFKKSFAVYFKRSEDGRGRFLLYSLMLLVVMSLAKLGDGDVQILFLLDTPFCWTSVHYGFYRAYLFALSCLCSILVTKLLQPRLGDLALAIAGCLSGAAQNIFMANAHSNTMMYLVPLFGIFQILPIGMIRSFNSKVVKPTELGAMFAVVAWLESLSALLSNLLCNAVYRATLLWYRGFVFLVLGGIYLLAGQLTAILICWLRRSGFSRQQLTASVNEPQSD